MLSVLTQFLSNLSQYVVVDGCRGKFFNVVSGVPRRNVWARSCFSCTLQSFFSIVENKLYGYADDSTLVAVVPTPGETVAV